MLFNFFFVLVPIDNTIIIKMFIFIFDVISLYALKDWEVGSPTLICTFIYFLSYVSYDKIF